MKKPIIALPPYAKLGDYETAIASPAAEPRRLEIGRDDPADVIRRVDALAAARRRRRRAVVCTARLVIARSTPPRTGATTSRSSWRSVRETSACRSWRFVVVFSC